MLFRSHLVTPEEIITANSQAEATQVEQLQEEVHNLISSLDEKIGQLQIAAAGSEKDAETAAAAAEAAAAATAEATATAAAEAVDEKLSQVKDDLESHIHKENVRVYRNVQAALGEELTKQSGEIHEKLEAQSVRLDEGLENINRNLGEQLSERLDMLSAMMETLNEQQKGQGMTLTEMAVQLNDTQTNLSKSLKSRALLAIQIVMLILVLGDLAINVLLTLGFL